VTIATSESVVTRSLTAGPAVELVLVADGLAVAMLVMTTVTAVVVAAFASEQDRSRPGARHRWFWPLWFVLWAALHLLFLSGDLLTAYLMLEAIGVAGAALVALDGERRTVLAATRYLYAELVASMTVLAGIALIWQQTGSLRFAELGPDLVAHPQGWLALGVVTVGLLLKMPLAPLHLWLPAAHALAPSAVSPILSAVVVKSAFAVLIRSWFLVAPELVTRSAAQLLGCLGVVAIVWGSLVALRTSHLKELIAYSTVAQLGFLMLLVPLVQAGAGDAWRGGVLYAVAHALAKGALLLAAAVIVEAAERPDLDALVGAVRHQPLAVFAFGIAALSLIGLPPSGGFVAKWYLLVASLQTGQWWWIAPIVGGSLLTAGYLLRLLRPAFATPVATGGRPPTAGEVPPERASGARLVTGPAARGALALALSLTTVALGVRPMEALALLDIGAPPLTGGG
jgi:multicomponent Na+:H+ antiporter subunit D